PARACAMERPAVSIEWRDTDESSDLLSIQSPKLRQLGQHCSGADRAYARHRAEQVLLLAPGGAASDGFVDIVVCSSKRFFEPVDVLSNACLQSFCGRDREPILFHRQHIDELTAATQVLLELLRFLRR